jgi:4-hydroxybenzoate polyprenyltransferase
MAKETFLQYCTRPTGFGKTPWPQTVIIFLFGVGVTVGIASLAPWWSPLGMLPFAALVFGTWMNYTGRWK